MKTFASRLKFSGSGMRWKSALRMLMSLKKFKLTMSTLKPEAISLPLYIFTG